MRRRSVPQLHCFNVEDISTLVDIVGRSGAIGALFCSDVVKINELRELANRLHLETTSRTPKKQLAERIVRQVDRRITKSLNELQDLSRDEIFGYLNGTDCDAEDLMDLLKDANLPVRTKMSRKDLMEFAAIQISELGIFERISNSTLGIETQPKGTRVSSARRTPTTRSQINSNQN